MMIEQNRRCAISYLNELKASTSGYSVEWLDMAIKALEQQPCEDCISRQKLLSRIDAERKHLLDIKMDGAEHIIVHHARRIIEDMPSITPQQTRWIPVSERLPKENEYIGNVCKYYLIQDEYGDMHVAHLSNVGWIPMGSLKAIGDEIIAWMPLPQPYNAESEVNADGLEESS